MEDAVTTTNDDARRGQDYFTDEEIAVLRRQAAEMNEAARAEWVRRGVGVHPRILAARIAGARI